MVRNLLDQVADQNQLIRLITNLELEGVEVFGKFLQQNQFRCLDIESFEVEAKHQLLALVHANKDALKGKFLVWSKYIKFHDNSFVSLGRVDEKAIRFESEDLAVEYYKDASQHGTSDIEFMESATQTIVQFI